MSEGFAVIKIEDDDLNTGPNPFVVQESETPSQAMQRSNAALEEELNMILLKKKQTALAKRIAQEKKDLEQEELDIATLTFEREKLAVKKRKLEEQRQQELYGFVPEAPHFSGGPGTSTGPMMQQGPGNSHYFQNGPGPLGPFGNQSAMSQQVPQYPGHVQNVQGSSIPHGPLQYRGGSLEANGQFGFDARTPQNFMENASNQSQNQAQNQVQTPHHRQTTFGPYQPQKPPQFQSNPSISNIRSLQDQEPPKQFQGHFDKSFESFEAPEDQEEAVNLEDVLDPLNVPENPSGPPPPKKNRGGRPKKNATVQIHAVRATTPSSTTGLHHHLYTNGHFFKRTHVTGNRCSWKCTICSKCYARVTTNAEATQIYHISNDHSHGPIPAEVLEVCGLKPLDSDQFELVENATIRKPLCEYRKLLKFEMENGLTTQSQAQEDDVEYQYFNMQDEDVIIIEDTETMNQNEANPSNQTRRLSRREREKEMENHIELLNSMNQELWDQNHALLEQKAIDEEDLVGLESDYQSEVAKNERMVLDYEHFKETWEEREEGYRKQFMEAVNENREKGRMEAWEEFNRLQRDNRGHGLQDQRFFQEKERADRLQEELDDLKSRIQRQVTDPLALVTGLKNKVREEQVKLEAAVKENGKKDLEIETLKNQVSRRNQTIQRLQNENKQQKDEQEKQGEKDRTIDDLTQKLTLQNETILRLENEQKQQKKESEQEKNEVVKAKDLEIQDLKNQVASQNETIQRLENEKKQQKDDAEQKKQGEVAALEEELRQVNKDKQKEIKDLQNNVKLLEAKARVQKKQEPIVKEEVPESDDSVLEGIQRCWLNYTGATAPESGHDMFFQHVPAPPPVPAPRKRKAQAPRDPAAKKTATTKKATGKKNKGKGKKGN